MLKTLFTKPIGTLVIAELFRVSLLAYLLLRILEYLVPGSVSRFLSLTVVLVFVLASGVGATLFPEPESHAASDRRKLWRGDFFLIATPPVLVAALVYSRTHSIGLLAVGITVLSGLIIVSLSLLLLFDNDEADDDNFM